MAGQEVKIAGWVHEIRDIGKIMFLLVRDRTGIAQVIAKRGVTDAGIMESMSLPKESVIMVKGVIKANPESKKGFEIIPFEVKNLNPLKETMPFEVTGKVPADIDVRLNNRQIDIRREETTAIFNIQSTILESFRNTLIKEGFNEIRTPVLVKEATEGGSDLFSVDYFGTNAYLAQSPQIYKQLAVIGGLDRVFVITPVFRAEKSNTTFHLNEITQMDIEMGFADYNDAIHMLKHVSQNILEEVKKQNPKDLELLGVEIKNTKIHELTYSDAVKKLNEKGHPMGFGKDFSRADEEAIHNFFGDLVLIKEFPTAVRAFYSMPSEENPEFCHSYDLIYKGLEISSGAQRIHDPSMLADALKKRGEDPEKFSFYINSFKQGAPPHAGWSIGLERLTMKLTNMSNIRECALFPRDRTRLVP
ncbi:MAG: aspartate--tRNA(Asn) ligase [Candidatus Marsarchaeota archaeon]|jgi:aspartyl-tRNA synthetase|nr:aspartate--tRNA(Asn) ligase [Candidatus Marsarchaeota archaeon]